MKKSALKNPSYKALLLSFKDWLDVLGFSEGMRKNYPNHLCEFFYWLECHGHTEINIINKDIVKQYYNYLKQRPNKSRSGALSASSLNHHQQALHKFRDYLSKHHKKPFKMHIKREKVEDEKLKYCTTEEVKQLFKATKYSHELPRFRARQKALLVCLYSLGMRRNEVINLMLNDILWDKERVFIRKGKNYKERFVPINHYNLRMLEDYVFDARLDFKQASESDYVFVSRRSTKISGCTIENDLKMIIKASNSEELKYRNITPHMLRHSIATHFLRAGMKIEDIQQFLGHASLESTQIYTHILKDD
ncbi:tyrosine-type recombinase/integrase [Zunongwangia pacifica]|uniref:Tyrosine-type recombinase/integrase n=1 Tax=Zunongwangia pacifica TaxID=2911062 RepID=A0A9X2CN35_9FLAO|nr:tyrosine-type recombinase/integrase [Zunongwangia pacifica]MCL6220155.1 tyrosine-type recombinase/integrase [Zunongwangia pacifica]